eukprot:gene31398-37952_t
MGGKIVVPEPDVNIRKVIKNFHFNPKDISDFWKLFQKLDKDKTGLVALNVIFKSFEMERNLLTDCLLELLDIEHDGEINFSDFLLMVTTYCFFEPICFYCFDQDKSGFFSIDDLNNLMNVVHNVKRGKTVHGTVKASWMQLTFKADQVDFSEFVKIHTAFPRLFEPAFRLQQLMMMHTTGEMWWTLKKRAMQDHKEEAEFKLRQQAEKKERKKMQKRNRKIQRNMGLLKYYLCPCFRALYDPTLTAYDKMTEAEKAEFDKQAAVLRRQAELKLKNPETAAWRKYEKKLGLGTIVETDGLKESKQPSSSPTVSLVSLAVEDLMAESKVPYLEEKILATQRPREERAMTREERRKQRKQQLQEIV